MRSKMLLSGFVALGLVVGCAGGDEDIGGPASPTPAGGDAASDSSPTSSETGDDPDTGTSDPGTDTATPEPTRNYGPKDAPLFKTPAELCAYVNEQRDAYASHDRFKGPPWSGSYHTDTTWPLHLTVDASLSDDARGRATKLAAGAKPDGAPYSDGSPPPHEWLYVSGVDTDRYVVASNEKGGDWTTDLAGNLHAGITTNNGTARMALFYHDAGSSGPVLKRIGCGGAVSPGGSSWWWVIVMAP